MKLMIRAVQTLATSAVIALDDIDAGMLSSTIVVAVIRLNGRSR